MSCAHHCFLLALLAACGGGQTSAPDASPSNDAATDAPVFYTNLVQYTDTYEGTGNGDLTSCNATQGLYGYEPVGAGPAPVFIYLVGTAANYQGADADLYLRGAAALGYVTASFNYDGTSVGDCTMVTSTQRSAPILKKAECMFDATGQSASALAKVCSRPSVDCTKGIVTMGHSQGGFLAIMGGNFDSRVRAAVGLSDTNKADVQTLHLDFANCIDDPSKNALSLRKIDKSHILLLRGANDPYATLGPSPGAMDYIQSITGSASPCGPSCLAANGSGYYIVQPTDLVPASQSGSQDGHCWMFDAPTDCGPGYSAANAGFDPNWWGGKGIASAISAVTFLDQFVTR